MVPLRPVERLRGELAVETVLTAYGLSEAGGFVTMHRHGDDPSLIRRPRERAIPGTEK